MNLLSKFHVESGKNSAGCCTAPDVLALWVYQRFPWGETGAGCCTAPDMLASWVYQRFPWGETLADYDPVQALSVV